MEQSESNQTIKFNAVVFPQPAKKTLIVNANFAVKDYSVRSCIGKSCLNKKVNDHSFFTIDITSLVMGVYILSLIGVQDENFELLFAKM
jgi:hypothetical protein